MELIRNQEIETAVQALIELLDSKQRGDVVTWEEIEKATKLARDDFRCRYVVRKARARFLNLNKVAIWPNHRDGFDVLGHADQVRICGEKRYRKMSRQAQRAKHEVEAADPTQMSTHDRRLRLFTLDQLKADQKSIRGHLKEMQTIRKTEPLPQRPLKDFAS